MKNGLVVIGGGTQIVAGVALCETVIGCALGAPLISVGVTNVVDGVSGLMHPAGEGFNILTGALEQGMSPDAAVGTNGIINLGLDLATLNAPNLAARTPELIIRQKSTFKYVVDTARGKDSLTRAGITIQATSSTFTTMSTLSGMNGD